MKQPMEKGKESHQTQLGRYKSGKSKQTLPVADTEVLASDGPSHKAGAEEKVKGTPTMDRVQSTVVQYCNVQLYKLQY